ncbi:hypothetical protein ACK2M7_12745 [Chryseobacterium sp. TY4]
MMILTRCTEKDNRKVFNEIASIEQNIEVRDALLRSPLIQQEGQKRDVVPQIIRIIEFYLEVTGNKKMESYQVKVMAGDLYERFRTDTVDDIILMFKMMRTGELGKVGYTESFNEKLMAYVDLYMLHKSEEREKLINQQKRKIRERDVKAEPMSPEAAAKFEELQKRLTVREQVKASTFSISKALQSMDAYLETLPETSMKLSDSDLKYEIRKTQNSHQEAYEILMLEAERRKIEKKKGTNRK